MSNSIFEKTGDEIYDLFTNQEEEENDEPVDDYRNEDRMTQMIDKYGY